jgi:hypothetical protein
MHPLRGLHVAFRGFQIKCEAISLGRERGERECPPQPGDERVGAGREPQRVGRETGFGVTAPALLVLRLRCSDLIEPCSSKRSISLLPLLHAATDRSPILLPLLLLRPILLS